MLLNPVILHAFDEYEIPVNLSLRWTAISVPSDEPHEYRLSVEVTCAKADDGTRTAKNIKPNKIGIELFNIDFQNIVIISISIQSM